MEAPGVSLRMPCWCSTREAVGVFGHRLDRCLNDYWRRWGRTDHRAAPTPGGRAPMSEPHIAARVPSHEGCEAPRGRRQITVCIFTRPAQVTDHCRGDRGDSDRGECP
jgi:hypothetical protein